MINIVALENYHVVFYNLLLLVVILVFAQSFSTPISNKNNLSTKAVLSFLVMTFAIFYIGFRPISFTFADMAVYAQVYQAYQEGAPLVTDKDVLFEVFMRTCAQIIPVSFFFLLCAFIYIMPMYLFAKKKLNNYWPYCFLMLVLSFSFWAYGTNGVRNGIATSLFLLALSRNNKINIAIWMVLAVLIHQSLIVPAIAYIITLFYKNTKIILTGWLLTIPLSIAFGGVWENLFMSVGFIDSDRVVGYLSGSEQYLDGVVEVQTGFRWDFLLYSASGVLAGWYFIVKKKFEDLFYQQLFATYLIANGLWVLVIRANFSNRIAYLSWFLLGAVIIYPLLKNKILNQQHQRVGGIILIYFLFTYVTNVFLAK
jgi:hypothetical protein